MTTKTQKGASPPLVQIAQDPRIGFAGVQPQVTVTGAPLPYPAPSTVGVGYGYVVALNAFPSSEQDAAIAELRTLIAQSGTRVPEVANDEPTAD